MLYGQSIVRFRDSKLANPICGLTLKIEYDNACFANYCLKQPPLDGRLFFTG